MHIQRTLTEIMKDSNDFDHIEINYPDLRATFYTQGFEFNKFRGDDHFEELDEMEEQERKQRRNRTLYCNRYRDRAPEIGLDATQQQDVEMQAEQAVDEEETNRRRQREERELQMHGKVDSMLQHLTHISNIQTAMAQRQPEQKPPTHEQANQTETPQKTTVESQTPASQQPESAKKRLFQDEPPDTGGASSSGEPRINVEQAKRRAKAGDFVPHFHKIAREKNLNIHDLKRQIFYQGFDVPPEPAQADKKKT